MLKSAFLNFFRKIPEDRKTPLVPCLFLVWPNVNYQRPLTQTKLMNQNLFHLLTDCDSLWSLFDVEFCFLERGRETLKRKHHPDGIQRGCLGGGGGEGCLRDVICRPLLPDTHLSSTASAIDWIGEVHKNRVHTLTNISCNEMEITLHSFLLYCTATNNTSSRTLTSPPLDWIGQSVHKSKVHTLVWAEISSAMRWTMHCTLFCFIAL